MQNRKNIKDLTSKGLTKKEFESHDETEESKICIRRRGKGVRDFDVNVFYNRMIIDAKSLLGVLSLDLTKILTVEYDGENAPFEAFLERKNPMHAVA